jgi:predicted nuclease with RNAse H fold
MSLQSARVVGIDVGGPSKGYHAVGLEGDRVIDTYRANSAAEMGAWCIGFAPQSISIDAPCAWSLTGRARVAERQLMAKGIWCFSTPTRDMALTHPKQYYGWMLAGEALFRALSAHWILFTGRGFEPGHPVMFETFPHGIACALANRCVSAKGKSQRRRELLTRCGLETGALRTIDFVDAGLCALTAKHFLLSNTATFGDRETGFIVLPKSDYLSQ